MKRLIIIYLLLTTYVNIQEKKSLEYQECELKSFKENKVFVSEKEGIWLDNIYKLEMDIL